MVAAGTCLCLSSRLHGAVINWINPAGGLANVASNWSPAQVPTAADDLSFNLAGFYSVTYGADVGTTRTQTYRQGTVTASLGSHTITSQLQVGQLNGNNATLNMSGIVTSTSFVTVGRDAGSIGVLTVNPGINTLTASGAGFDIIIGQAGQGTLNIAGGNQVRIDTNADDIIIGNLSGSIGTVNVSSTNPQLAVLRINNTAPGADLIIGASGTGSLNLGTRASVTAGFNAFIALNPGSVGVLSLTDSIINASSALNVPNDLHVGHNTTAAAAGTATITINDDGIVQAGVGATTGTLFLGDANGGSGTINLIQGEVRTQNFVIDPVNGHFNHTGGRLRILPGGSFTTNTRLELSGSSATNAPYAEFRTSTGTLTGGFRIGNTGFGDLEITQGAIVNAIPQPPGGTGSGLMMIGHAAGSEGTLTISGAGSRLITSDIPAGFTIGSAGTGHVILSDHATLDTHSHILMAATPASVATLDIESSSTVVSHAGLYIGGLSAPQGAATINLSGSSSLVAPEARLRVGSALDINDSTVTIANSATLEGLTTLAQGAELAAASIILNGYLAGSGNVYGVISASPNSVISAIGGDLFLGSPTNAPNSFTSSGTLAVNDQSVHILSSSPWLAETITMGGGSINGTGGVVFSPNGSFTGGGSINTPMQFDAQTFVRAEINPGFTFNAPVTGHLRASNGSTITFAAGGDFTGQGNIATAVRSEEEASITATGDLSLGLDSINNCVQLVGPLHVGSHLVTLRSNTPANLGVLTTVEGGTLQGPADNSHIIPIGNLELTIIDPVPLVLSAGVVVSGRGSVTTKIQAFPTSLIQLTGNMSFVGSGGSSIISGVGNQYIPWDATFNVGPHAATFGGIHQMGGIARVDGGMIEAGFLRILGTLSGHGVLRSAAAVQNIGLISPGGANIGEFVIQGPFESASTTEGGSTLEVDVDGDQGSLHDTIRVEGGDVTLAGHIRVRVLSVPPDPAVEYPLITTDTGIITGAFDTADLPAGMTLVYRSQEVVLTGFCPADFNQDGGIDGSDVDAFFASWESGDAAADVNRDGGVDGSDVGVFFSLWEAGGC